MKMETYKYYYMQQNGIPTTYSVPINQESELKVSNEILNTARCKIKAGMKRINIAGLCRK